MDIRAGWSKAFYKDSKTGETVAYYYDTDGKTSRLPPPPPLSDDEDDSDGSSLAPEISRHKTSGDMRMHFPQPPPDALEADSGIFDPQANLLRGTLLLAEDSTASSKDDQEQMTALVRTFDPDTMLKRDLIPRCHREEIPINVGMSLQEMKAFVRKFFIELHKEEGTTLHQSKCYIARDQAIERKRSKTTAEKRKSKFAADAVPRKKQGTVANPRKKRGLTVREIMSNFPDDGFYIDGANVRCGCSKKIISGKHRDYSSIWKHVETAKKHLEYKRRRELTGTTDGRLSNAAVATHAADENGVTRMDLDGTRTSSVTNVDASFRFRVTRMLLGAGIPLASLKVIRPAMEDMCQMPLAANNTLASEYIAKILTEEVGTQLQELLGKRVALCFDAMPRMGDVFAIIVRYVETADGTFNRCI